MDTTDEIPVTVSYPRSLEVDVALQELIDAGDIDVQALVEKVRAEIRAERAAKRFCIATAVLAVLLFILAKAVNAI